MKKVVLLFVIAIAAVSANAQGVKFGVKAGIGIMGSKLSQGSTSEKFSSQVGFVGGITAEVPVGSSFSIQPEVLYSMEGGKDNGDKLNLSYLNVPVLVKYKIAAAPGLGIYVGPQLGFLMSAKDKSGGSSTDVKDQLKSTNFSGVFGAEYAFMQCLVVSARYQAGFSNIADFSSAKLKSHGFQLTIGYLFGGNMGKKK